MKVCDLDFEDMSCEMIFGQEPPETTEDPVMKQPCYKICKFLLEAYMFKENKKDFFGSVNMSILLIILKRAQNGTQILLKYFHEQVTRILCFMTRTKIYDPHNTVILYNVYS